MLRALQASPGAHPSLGQGLAGITDRAHRGHAAGGRLSRHGPGQEQMESRVQLICQVPDGLHTGQKGRQGQCWQPATAATLPFFSLICLRGLLYSPHLSCTEHRGCGACGGWGTTGLLNIPSPSPGHGKTFLTQEHKLRERKQPQKINLFSTIFSFSSLSFQPFWDLAHLLWDRRIRENHESSHKVFVHVKEEGGKRHQKKKKRN